MKTLLLVAAVVMILINLAVMYLAETPPWAWAMVSISFALFFLISMRRP